MSLASEDWLSMMLSGLATEPWLTEIVKLGRAAGAELPPVVAQMTTPTIDGEDHRGRAVDASALALVDGNWLVGLGACLR